MREDLTQRRCQLNRRKKRLRPGLAKIHVRVKNQFTLVERQCTRTARAYDTRLTGDSRDRKAVNLAIVFEFESGRPRYDVVHPNRQVKSLRSVG